MLSSKSEPFHLVAANAPKSGAPADVFPFLALEELLDAIARARVEGETAQVHRIVLRRLRALGSDLARAGRLARRGKAGGAYQTIAWQRAESISRASLEIACLPAVTRRRLYEAAARVLARSVENQNRMQGRVSVDARR